MTHTTRLRGTDDSRAQGFRPLDETVWRTWMKKNLLEERRRAATRTKTVNWVCIGVLALAVVTSSQISLSNVAAYQAAVRLVIGIGATVMVFDNIRSRNYAFAALFGSLILLYNPVLPAFAVSGSGPILLASVLPFVGFLIRVRNNERGEASRIAHQHS